MTAGAVPHHPSSAAGRDAVRATPPLFHADLVFVVMAGVAIVVRASHLSIDGAPVGVDGGNWLAFGNALLGGPARPEGVTYPPIVPLLTTAAAAALGPVTGLVMVGAVSAVAPAVAVYHVARRTARDVAPLLAGILLVSLSAGTMAAWGGYPQLLGGALVVAALWTLTGWLCSGDRRALACAVAASTLVLATSHAAAAVGAVGWGGVATVTLIRGRRAGRRRLLAATIAAAVAALPLAPVYGRLLPALVGARDAEPAMASIPLADVPAQFVVVHGAAWPVWAVGCVVAVAAVARDRGRTRLGVLTAGPLLGLPALLLLTGQPRVLHEIPLIAVTGLTLGASQATTRARRRAVAIASAVALVVVTMSGLMDVPRAQAAYAVLDRDLLEAVTWLDENAPDDATVAVPAVRGAPLGWWVEGLTRRQVIYAAPLRWLMFDAERARARVANDLFHRIGVPTRQGIRTAARLGVDYVLLPTDGPAYRPDAVAKWRRRVVFDNAAAVVIEVEKP